MAHVDRIWMPGEQSHAKRVENERDGIPIATPLLRILDQLADDLRVQRLL
jgi:LDH2 family malate/lactate/ureidoglycolate dehydrogenase